MAMIEPGPGPGKKGKALGKAKVTLQMEIGKDGIKKLILPLSPGVIKLLRKGKFQKPSPFPCKLVHGR